MNSQRKQNQKENAVVVFTRRGKIKEVARGKEMVGT